MDGSSNGSSATGCNNNILGAVSYLDYNESQQQQIFYLPLTNNEGQLLPIHFLNSSEVDGVFFCFCSIKANKYLFTHHSILLNKVKSWLC